jgi:hypothetical protein
MTMRLRALLDTDGLGLRLLAGEEELDRTVRGVMTTALRDPSRYLSGGELVLTELAWWRGPEDSEYFVRLLAAAGVAGLAAGEAALGRVPQDLVAACHRHRLPLFSVDQKVPFAVVTEHVVRQVSTQRSGDLAAVVDRHRRLMSSGPAGGGPDAVLDLLGSDLDLRAWVLSATGRVIAGAADALPPGLRTQLAAEHLGAVRSGRPVPHRTSSGSRHYSLFPVRGERAPADVRRTLLSDWLLAVEADAGDWPSGRLDLLRGVAQIVAVERDRRDAARTMRRRLAGEVVELLRAGAPPTEVAGRLRLAAPVLLPALGSAPRWQVAVARVEWPDGPVPVGPIAQALLEEALPETVAVTYEAEEAVALVPLDPGADDAVVLRADRLLAALREPLSRGLGDDGRLALGISAAVHTADGLRGALEEARHARRVATAHPGQVCVAGHEELASHVLLLPFVPDDVRRAFTTRLLEPLHTYDRRHRAELIPTLEAFLACDGSWTRCATRLHLHVNTLRYRMGRIEHLTGRDLSRLEDKLDFFLALRMS